MTKKRVSAQVVSVATTYHLYWTTVTEEMGLSSKNN